MPKINFIPYSHEAELASFPPIPATKVIPNWYKSIHPYANGDKKMRFPMESGVPNSSMKKCVPFLDALTAGYVAVLDDDIYVENVNGEPFIRWRTSDTMLTWHSRDQFATFPIPNTYHSMVAKWHNEWMIELPEGYSAYFTHPSNRFDLPFTTIAGIIDCDTWKSPVHFPFMLKKGFEGVIPSGTPVAQIILFKRENWKSSIGKYDPDQVYLSKKNFFKTFAASYKKNFWHRKSFS